MEVKVIARVEVFPNRLGEVAQNPAGVVAQHVRSSADSLLNAAEPLIGPKGYQGHHPARGKRLAESGAVVPIGGPNWAVEFRHPIAIIHHEGTKAHEMPRMPKGRVYFRRGPGGYRFGPTRGPISHPGHPGNPYLINAAAQSGMRRSGSLLRGSQLIPIVRTPRSAV